MRSGLLAFLFLAFASFSANAEVCQRSSTSTKMAGLDLDVVQCQMALLASKMGQSDLSTAGLEAQVTLLTNDLTAARTSASTREKEWEDYFAAYTKAPEGVVLPHDPSNEEGLLQKVPDEHGLHFLHLDPAK